MILSLSTGLFFISLDMIKHAKFSFLFYNPLFKLDIDIIFLGKSCTLDLFFDIDRI